MINAFGSNHEEIGSLNKNLILKTQGKIKIQYGKKCIDLLNNNGEINVVIPKVIKSIDEIESIKESGFYYVDGGLVAYIEGQTIELGKGGTSTYVSYIGKQEVDGEHKENALINIGLIYKTLSDANQNPPTNGFIYVESERNFYIVAKGKLSKFNPSGSLPNPITERLVISKSDTTSEGALAIAGEGPTNGIVFDGVNIYPEQGKLYYNTDKGQYFRVGGVDMLEISSNGVETSKIQSPGASTTVGYRIYRDSTGGYTLTIDSLYVRNGIAPDVYLPKNTYYNEQNVVLSADLVDDNSTDLNVILKYKTEYQVGDKVWIYIEKSVDDKVYKEKDFVKGTIKEVQEENVIVITPEEELPSAVDFTNKNIFLVEKAGELNNSLIIGEFEDDWKYKEDEKVGIISKQNVFYSTKFTTKEPDKPEDYAFYDDDTYGTLVEKTDDESYDKVLASLGLILKKKLTKGGNYIQVGQTLEDALIALDTKLKEIADKGNSSSGGST